MEYLYYIDYDSEKREFLGHVHSERGLSEYTIADTDSMIDLIESGEMNHIDDYRGLESFLRKEGVFGSSDYIVGCVLWE